MSRNPNAPREVLAVNPRNEELETAIFLPSFFGMRSGITFPDDGEAANTHMSTNIVYEEID